MPIVFAMLSPSIQAQAVPPHTTASQVTYISVQADLMHFSGICMGDVDILGQKPKRAKTRFRPKIRWKRMILGGVYILSL